MIRVWPFRSFVADFCEGVKLQGVNVLPRSVCCTFDGELLAEVASGFRALLQNRPRAPLLKSLGSLLRVFRVRRGDLGFAVFGKHIVEGLGNEPMQSVVVLDG